MRYHVLVCDYDGTIAFDGRVNEKVLAALKRLKASGRKLILVTGRELDDILFVFPEISLFDRVVAENGSVLYDPASREEKAIGGAAARPVRSGSSRAGDSSFIDGKGGHRHPGTERDEGARSDPGPWPRIAGHIQ